jgi:sugar/nucleoside kinase (ribokinase family)
MTTLIVGDANADLSAALSRFPSEGDDAPIAGLGWGSGGSAANTAAALALLGEPARLLARVGHDPAAEIALGAARAAGADLAAIQRDGGLATGLCFAAVSPGGERTFFSYRGANVALEQPPAEVWAGVRWLHVAGHALLEGSQRETTLALLAAAADRDIPASLDLCLPSLRAWPAATLEILPGLKILFANEKELGLLLPSLPEPLTAEGALAQADRLARLGAPVVVAKLGPRGCVVAAGQQCCAAPAFAVDAVDTNGCGDAFVAGFLFAYLRGQSLDRCAMLGNALGGLASTRAGAAEALPARDTLRAFLAERGQRDAAALLDAKA